MITVPCCIECNGKYEQLDEKMRNYMVSLVPLSSEPVTKGRHAVLKSKKLSQEYIANTKTHPTLVDENGQHRLVFYFNTEELNIWLNRIVKGLFFYENRQRLSDESIITAKALPEIQPQPSATFPFEKGLERRPYFVYGVVHDEPHKDSWILIFYDKIIFIVTVYNPRNIT